MCRRKQSSKVGHTASEYNKKSTYKRELALQREVRAFPNRIKISSNDIITTRCARLLDRLAQAQGGYDERK